MNLYLCRLYNQMKKNILITGGAGFIGSHVVRLFVTKYPDYQIFNLDALTYAGNLENLKDIEKASNYHFVKADILDAATLKEIFAKHAITDVIHLAAESHVDRSIVSPLDFVYTNVIGTVNLLNTAKEYWKDDLSYDKAHDGSWDNQRDHLFYHVSTDEVYGSLGKEGLFKETTPYDPNSPYSASKAAADIATQSWRSSFGDHPISIARAGNVIGGGDIAENRLLPDLINCFIKNEGPKLRFPEAIRPWQHVLDPLAGYLLYLEGTLQKKINHQALNFGPLEASLEVSEILDVGRRVFGDKVNIVVKEEIGNREAKALELDASLANQTLLWSPKWNQKEAINDTFTWWKTVLKDPRDAYNNCLRDIDSLIATLQR
mgnify:CR=1 FL=1